jgi:hypothetical protein
MRLKLYMCVVWCLLLSSATAQLPGSRIIQFDGFVTSNVVGLRFTVSKGNACTGYNIYHSADSLNFSPIYQYAGICGSTTKDEQFSFTHQNPIPEQTNYYQVELVPLDKSRILRLFVSQTPQVQILPYPNPAKDILNVKISNTSNLKLFAFVFSAFGHPETQFAVDAKLDTVTMDVQELSSGMHVILLTDGNQVFPVKFIKE